MGYAFTTRSVFYKSYRAKVFSIRMSSNGSDPLGVTVKVTTAKKPTAEVSVGIGYFRVSRGVGGTTNKFVRFTDPETVALCRACLTDDSAIAGLIDMLTEKAESLKYAGARVVELATRWWVLAQQENPTAFVEAERKQRAFEDKRFAVGDRVRYSRGCGPAEDVTITGEQFDWHPYMGGGWRFSFPGVNAPQTYFRKIESPVAEPVA